METHARSLVPLAEQFRRWFAKPQRLVQFQHGIPNFSEHKC